MNNIDTSNNLDSLLDIIESILFLVEILENATPNFLIKRHLHFVS